MELNSDAYLGTIIIYAIIVIGIWFAAGWMGIEAQWSFMNKVLLTVVFLPITYFIVSAMANRG